MPEAIALDVTTINAAATDDYYEIDCNGARGLEVYNDGRHADDRLAIFVNPTASVVDNIQSNAAAARNYTTITLSPQTGWSLPIKAGEVAANVTVWLLWYTTEIPASGSITWIKRQG